MVRAHPLAERGAQKSAGRGGLGRRGRFLELTRELAAAAGLRGSFGRLPVLSEIF